MMSNALVFIVLAGVAVAFILWPFTRSRTESQAPVGYQDRLQTNIQLFHEQIDELAAALAAGRINPEQFAQLKLEQERNLLEDEVTTTLTERPQNTNMGRAILVLVCLLTVVVAAVLYQRWGSSADVAIQQMLQQKNQLDYQDVLRNQEPDRARAVELMSALDERLVDVPESSQYWFMLARTAMEIGNYPRAIEAYRKVLAFDPTASLAMGELAQVLFLSDKNRINPEIVTLAKSAIELDAKNTTALGLLGIDAFERKDFTAAASYWQRAVDVLGADAPGSRALTSGIARARGEAAKAGAEANDTIKGDPAAARSIQLLVELGADVESLAKDLPVYVYARAWQGARMPLAIQRLTLADLPALVTLDESMAMSPDLSLAQADQVEVVARIALDGSAIAKPGDWQGSFGPVDLNSPASRITLTIDRKILE
jgi:cytochrome c-type biogenesis protein CcmH